MNKPYVLREIATKVAEIRHGNICDDLDLINAVAAEEGYLINDEDELIIENIIAVSFEMVKCPTCGAWMYRDEMINDNLCIDCYIELQGDDIYG